MMACETLPALTIVSTVVREDMTTIGIRIGRSRSQTPSRATAGGTNITGIHSIKRADASFML
ncbi:MAG: hypothetical protein RR829_00700, partial [Oscillospiraceae bacterium]